MKSGICPKCGGCNIKSFRPRTFAGDRSAWDYEIVSAFKAASTTRYVCLDCGFSERYFDEKELEKIREKARKDDEKF